MDPSGVGKTTLLKILTTELKPTAGSVKINNKEIYHLKFSEKAHLRRKTFGILWQNPRKNVIWKLSVLENVLLPMMIDSRHSHLTQGKERALKLLDAFGVLSKKNNFPSVLSGGELQRVGLAVTLANDPQILFVDEPTSYLDTNTKIQTINFLRRLCNEENKTIIMVTHDWRLVHYVDKAYMMNNGRIEEIH